MRCLCVLWLITLSFPTLAADIYCLQTHEGKKVQCAAIAYSDGMWRVRSHPDGMEITFRADGVQSVSTAPSGGLGLAPSTSTARTARDIMRMETENQEMRAVIKTQADEISKLKADYDQLIISTTDEKEQYRAQISSLARINTPADPPSPPPMSPVSPAWQPGATRPSSTTPIYTGVPAYIPNGRGGFVPYTTAPLYADRTSELKAKSAQLRNGLSRESVLILMGKPDSVTRNESRGPGYSEVSENWVYYDKTIDVWIYLIFEHNTLTFISIDQ
jgi:hypothetical protein